MPDLTEQLNKIASDKGTAGKQDALLALAALALVDKNGNVVFDADDLPASLGRLLAAGSDGVVNLSGDVAPDNSAEAATLSTNLTGNNNDLVFTAIPTGAAGNGITIEYRDPGAISQLLSVVVQGGGRAILVKLATDGAGLITTTAAQIATALAASALVTVANKGGNDGTGHVIAMAPTPLAGGTDGTGVGVAGKGSRYFNTADGSLWINKGDKVTPNWSQLFPLDEDNVFTDAYGNGSLTTLHQVLANVSSRLDALEA